MMQPCGSRTSMVSLALIALSASLQNGMMIEAFAPSPAFAVSTTALSAEATSSTAVSFIDTELRGAAMKLHTREQAPKEGEAPAKKMEPYVPTRADYLQFLVDSQHVYQALEDIVNRNDELAVFRSCGLERTAPLEKDIEFMASEYGLSRPPVGKFGKDYATSLRAMESTPELVCHFYNFYFAHTAGGRMIGKKMSAMLLEKKTLAFYEWDGDLNEIKSRVKGDIEAMAASWSDEERKECVDATAATFVGGGSINSYLSGGQNPH
uniref:Heme oxygenase (biliverdin-producing) n=1 Tax=Entomoneis paludosa TaxID=265537 RepID=A0A7S2YNV1_9STRA|mmetsp:Transcript_40286/g.83889  ORF Transcript_40286/g.83889 Transcript_40286/m.83889 type:complete len:265 (+) Transcript_40286:84-878(+)